MTTGARQGGVLSPLLVSVYTIMQMTFVYEATFWIIGRFPRFMIHVFVDYFSMQGRQTEFTNGIVLNGHIIFTIPNAIFDVKQLDFVETP